MRKESGGIRSWNDEQWPDYFLRSVILDVGTVGFACDDPDFKNNVCWEAGKWRNNHNSNKDDLLCNSARKKQDWTAAYTWT